MLRPGKIPVTGFLMESGSALIYSVVLGPLLRSGEGGARGILRGWGLWWRKIIISKLNIEKYCLVVIVSLKDKFRIK
jgi:hypothetical protein